MGSQTDLDQGGTFRQTQSIYMGPSIGWQTAPASVILPATTSGTTIVQLGNTLITINVNGLVTLQLPIFKGSVAGAIGIPGTFIGRPITIVDIGGFVSAANPVTILPSGSELIDGQSSILFVSPYGAMQLTPDVIHGGAALTQ